MSGWSSPGTAGRSLSPPHLVTSCYGNPQHHPTDAGPAPGNANAILGDPASSLAWTWGSSLSVRVLFGLTARNPVSCNVTAER